MIFVIRIAGQVKNKKKDNETLKRLKLNRKFAAILIDEKDKIRIGMINAVNYMVAYGKIDETFTKELIKKRGKGPVFHLHPPRGGFKKSSKVSTPKGILGEHDDITKLAGRML